MSNNTETLIPHQSSTGASRKENSRQDIVQIKNTQRVGLPGRFWICEVSPETGRWQRSLKNVRVHGEGRFGLEKRKCHWWTWCWGGHGPQRGWPWLRLTFNLTCLLISWHKISVNLAKNTDMRCDIWGRRDRSCWVWIRNHSFFSLQDSLHLRCPIRQVKNNKRTFFKLVNK